MRNHCALVLLLLVPPAGLAGQSTGRPWSITLGVAGVRFGSTAHDTVSPDGSAVHLKPSGRVGIRAALRRTLGVWGIAVGVGWAQGDVEAANDAVAIRDRTADLSRYRLAAGVERRVARLGAGEVALGLGPTLDLWTLDGDTRVRVGAEGGLALRVPLGSAVLENRIALGLSASPLEASEVGEEFQLRRLRAVEVGVGLRVPL